MNAFVQIERENGGPCSPQWIEQVSGKQGFNALFVALAYPSLICTTATFVFFTGLENQFANPPDLQLQGLLGIMPLG